MTDLANEIIKLGLYESRPIVNLMTLAPGLYTQRLLTQGNSLLSTVFVESVDPGASVSVRYYDFTVGASVGEEDELATHVTLNTPISFDRITVPRLHDKPVVEITVTGGSVRFGVYVTVVASFATDLDQALKIDGQVADLLKDKGIPIHLYDETLGKFFFLRGDMGVIPVSFNEAGDNFILGGDDITTPGVIQELIVDTVPALKNRKLSKARVVCRAHSAYEITADGVIIGSGMTGPERPCDDIEWTPRATIDQNLDLKLRFLAHSSTTSGLLVRAYLFGSDLDA